MTVSSTTIACFVVGLLVVGLLLIVILVPMTFSYVEYYEYGLPQRKSTGIVDTDNVYGRGRYALGPDFTFLKYQADAHHVSIDDLSVFSAGASNQSIGTSFQLDIDLTFLLNRKDVGQLHREIASSYESVIISRAKDAIKNEAIFITFLEYFQSRMDVETRFREAVQKRWNEAPPVHCTLDQFHLGKIEIPEEVANKQLETKVQNERNAKEAFLQQAQIERERTDVEVNSILLEKSKVLRTAEAEAGLTRARATVEAQKIVQEAQNNGSLLLFEAANFTQQEHKIAFAYIRTLANRRENTTMLNVDYTENILRTKAV